MGRPEDRRNPQGVCVCLWTGLQPTVVRLGFRGYEEPELARRSPAHVQLLWWCCACDGTRLPEARCAQMPPVRSGSEPRLCTVGESILNMCCSGKAKSPER